MRKAFLCLLVLLFLLPTLAFSESPAAQPDSARAYADELQERFGITILIGDECVQRPEEDMFTVGYGFATTPLLSMIKRADTVNELKKIEQALVRYPVSFFQYLRGESHPDGVRSRPDEAERRRSPFRKCVPQTRFFFSGHLSSGKEYDNIRVYKMCVRMGGA